MNYINMSNSNCAAQNYLTKGTKHDQVKHLGLAFLTGRDASRQMNEINMSNSNCAAQHYLTKESVTNCADCAFCLQTMATKENKHDQVNHLGLVISGWTKRLEPQRHVCS